MKGEYQMPPAKELLEYVEYKQLVAQCEVLQKLLDDCKLPGGQNYTAEFLAGHSVCFEKIMNNILTVQGRLTPEKGKSNETK